MDVLQERFFEAVTMAITEEAGVDTITPIKEQQVIPIREHVGKELTCYTSIFSTCDKHQNRHAIECTSQTNRYYRLPFLGYVFPTSSTMMSFSGCLSE
jgi:hypothetical protein